MLIQVFVKKKKRSANPSPPLGFSHCLMGFQWDGFAVNFCTLGAHRQGAGFDDRVVAHVEVGGPPDHPP